MTFSQIQTEVRRRLNELNANFWSDSDVNRSINDGYDEMSDASEWYETSATVTTFANQTYYDMTSLTGSTVLSPKSCQNPTTKFWLHPVDPLFMDTQVHPRWGQIQSQPEYYLTRGLFQIGFAPKVNADSTLTLYFTAMPAELSAASDTPGFPQEYHYGIVEYALYDLLSQDAETAKALVHWKQYLEFEGALVLYVQGRIGHARVTTLRRT